MDLQYGKTPRNRVVEMIVSIGPWLTSRPQMSVKLFLYGGSPGEIGGNRILVELRDRRWLLDFGTRAKGGLGGQTGNSFRSLAD